MNMFKEIVDNIKLSVYHSEISNETLEDVLKFCEEIEQIKQYARKRLLEENKAGRYEKGKYEVISRTNKVFANPPDAEERLYNRFGDEIYETKLKPINKLKRFLKEIPNLEIVEETKEHLRKIPTNEEALAHRNKAQKEDS